MSTRFMLNETSYFGRGAREELAGELKKRNFKKTLAFLFVFCYYNKVRCEK